MPPECPECGSAKVAEIVYGHPSSDWKKDVDSGKVVLGGGTVQNRGSDQIQSNRCMSGHPN